ncbi:MAG: substrate-binding domain-containing protein [Eubacteriales bacterium]|nr:substrate-binding domain-containing protein [Eubacteriales bacterium]MDD4323231.1 substrate-binding domain-containing protein [Eubacteriales bacterium]MDD4541395.1 substrate-binding domain-containing protein [Eubacteriales bacterium]
MKRMKGILGLLLAMTLLFTLVACGDGGSASDTKEVAVMVPSADHGWTGAVLTYAQEKVDELNADDAFTEKYSAKLYSATGVENQIEQVDDLLTRKDELAGIVILPYDNGLQSSLEKIATQDVPFVQFDRVIHSDVIDENVVSNVLGDNVGIGYETGKRLLDLGLEPGHYVYEMIGDNSSVPELRSDGFRKALTEAGWTEEDIESTVVKSPATGWSRDTGKELFESWFSSSACDPSLTNWIFTHDDEIAMGILESMQGSALDESKKEAYLESLQSLASSSGLAEIYAVLKDKHQTIPHPEFDLFSVTYDPAMIKEAVDTLITKLDGGTVEQNLIIPVNVVDKDNVDEYQPFGSYDEKD